MNLSSLISKAAGAVAAVVVSLGLLAVLGVDSSRDPAYGATVHHLAVAGLAHSAAAWVHALPKHG